jgi:uncharacterized protein YndB with AHSA1/START domain
MLSRNLICALILAGSALVPPCALAGAADSTGLAQTAASIHQEVRLSGSCPQVYAALTDTRQFDAVTRLSDGASLLAAPGALPTRIDPQPGGEFALFGGYITGRNLELVPGERLVQAWRAKSWDAGAYSVVTFTLRNEAGGCLLMFEHAGFPQSQGPSLAYGWRVHYWVPLAKYLSSREPTGAAPQASR